MPRLSLHHEVLKARKADVRGHAPVLILLHGLRSNELDLLGLAPDVDERFFVVSARAPIAMGPEAFGWYNVQFTGSGFIVDDAEALRGRDAVLQFVEEVVESYPVDRDRVFLMGFSQGCIMSLGAALKHPHKFAGIVGMSGRLLDSMVPDPEPEIEVRNLPVLLVHGVQDTVIPIQYGRESRDKLTSLGVDLMYREYPMAHNVSMSSMNDIAHWLEARLNSKTDWRIAGA